MCQQKLNSRSTMSTKTTDNYIMFRYLIETVRLLFLFRELLQNLFLKKQTNTIMTKVIFNIISKNLEVISDK